MPKAEKLPSGSWRCRVYTHTDIVDGKKKKRYKTFTVSDPTVKGKRKCEKMAIEYSFNKSIENSLPTVEQGIERYINSKKNIISPATLRSYISMSHSGYEDIKDISMEFLNPLKIQEWINHRAESCSPKTVKNNVGLLSATFDLYGIPFPKVSLPKREPVKYTLPTKEELRILLDYCKENDTELEIAVMLGAFCGMRRGEICALTHNSLSGNKLTIDKNIVRGTLDLVEKSPKTYTSTRIIEIPDFVADKIRPIKGRIVKLAPDQLTSRFVRARDKLGLNPFRFHDLRHYAASTWAMLMPMNYVEQYGGWKPGSSVLKSVYINSMDEASKQYSQIANNYFEQMIKGQQ